MKKTIPKTSELKRFFNGFCVHSTVLKCCLKTAIFGIYTKHSKNFEIQKVLNGFFNTYHIFQTFIQISYAKHSKKIIFKRFLKTFHV